MQSFSQRETQYCRAGTVIGYWSRPLQDAQVGVNEGLAELGSAKRAESSVAMQQCTYERVPRWAGHCLIHAINTSKHLTSHILAPWLECLSWADDERQKEAGACPWWQNLVDKGCHDIIRKAGGWLISAGKKVVPQNSWNSGAKNQQMI